MQKTIQDTVEKERLQIYGGKPKTAETMKPKSAGEKADGILKSDQAEKVVLVDDHFSKKEETIKKEEDDEFIVHDVDDRDGLNDRVIQEDDEGVEGTTEGAVAGEEQDQQIPTVKAAAGTVGNGGLYVDTQKHEKVELAPTDEEDDNILRPPTKGKK